jgi:hypothetical protein
MKLHPASRAALIALAKDKGVRLEGNVLKVLEHDDDEEFKKYLEESLERDQTSRRKRLEITKQVQAQNRELQEAYSKLHEALTVAENAKTIVEQDLSILQKRTQFRLMHRIVNVALGIVMSVGIVSTLVYLYSLTTGSEVERIGTVWASLIGILLTNSFSILGTIMGVKYATEKED